MRISDWSSDVCSSDLFAPLAYTKTYAMAASAVLAVTLTPVLMGYLVRGRIRAERDNPLNRALQALYRPALLASLRHPRSAVLLAVLMLARDRKSTRLNSSH